MRSYLLEAFHSLSEAFPYFRELGWAKDESSHASDHCEFRNTKPKKCSGPTFTTIIITSAPTRPSKTIPIGRQAQRRMQTCIMFFSRED